MRRITDQGLELPDDLVAVVTMDQRASRVTPDAVDRHRKELNRRYRHALRRGFVRTAGDEMQCVAGQLGWIVEHLLEESRRAEWWIGVGIGPVDGPLGRTARDSSGPAFIAARAAVDEAKRRPWGFALDGAVGLGLPEAALVTTSWIVRQRTRLQQEAVDLWRENPRTVDVAADLGISFQAVSQRLRAAGVDEEDRGRELAWSLLLNAVGKTA